MFVLAFVVLFAFTVADPCAHLGGPGWAQIDTEVSTHCYKFSDKEQSFFNAENRCILKGGHLLQIDSQEENQMIDSVLKKNSWIGLHLARGVWSWIGTEDEAYYTHWDDDVIRSFISSAKLVSSFVRRARVVRCVPVNRQYSEFAKPSVGPESSSGSPGHQCPFDQMRLYI
ncbi:hypothetical protein ScPMuIL_016960 [Solemya velum]